MRRLFVPAVRVGMIQLDANEAHHLRDVLRLREGDALEVFDPAGLVGVARIHTISRDRVEIDILETSNAQPTRHIVVASAVPKNERADWLVEKLSELGVSRWVPLQTARSVVHPAGESKFTRWNRIAVEAAKQSRRPGVMTIYPLTPIASLAFDHPPIVLSTRPGSVPLSSLPTNACTLLIGPEGGWTEEELASLIARGSREASLTTTILRLETAAVVAAGIAIAIP